MIKELIASRLNKYFATYNNTSPTIIEVLDTSSIHSEHSAVRGINSLETHFDILIVSDKFIGYKPIDRHRIIYNILNDILGVSTTSIHALSIKTHTWSEYIPDNGIKK